MFRKAIIAIICVAFVACPWGKCGFAQESSPKEQQSALGEPAPEQQSGQQSQGPLLPKVMGDFRDSKMTKNHAMVTDVIDAVTIEIDNKTKVRLSGIWTPWDSNEDPGEIVKRAQTMLSKITKGRYVRLYQTKNELTGRVNRLGQTLAQVEREDGVWLQGTLLYAGLATVMTSDSNQESAKKMYQLEADARKNKRGLWEDPRWGVLKPENTADHINQYRIVEGKIFSTSLRDNTFFLNFSRSWQTDFTVMIPTNKRVEFAREHIDLMSLNGKTVRVRGWIRKFNGPLIQVTHPQQIEVLD